MRYQCDRCKKYFYSKTDYTRHLDRKYPCLPLDDVKKMEGEKERLTCIYCQKTYSHTKTLRKHYDICKVKKRLDEEDKLKMENTQLKKENEQLKKLLENQPAGDQLSIARDNNGIAGNNNHIDQSVNNTINIHINAIGEENTDFLTTEDKIDILKRMHQSLSVYIERVNFAEDHPENHNVYIPSVKNSYGSRLTKAKKKRKRSTKRWCTESIEDIVERLVDNGRIKLEEIRDELDHAISDYNKSRLDELFDAIDGDTSDKSQRILTNMNNKIRFIAVDNNQMVKETKKKWEKQNRKRIAI